MVQLVNERGSRLRACGVAAIGAIAVGAGLMMSGSAVAWADNDTLAADPATPSARPVAKDGIRSPAVQGEIRENGEQGVIRNSAKAVPPITASQRIDNPIEDDWDCLESWHGGC